MKTKERLQVYVAPKYAEALDTISVALGVSKHDLVAEFIKSLIEVCDVCNNPE